MFEVASAEISSPTLEFVYVTREDIGYYREILVNRYAKIRTIPRTRQWHFIAALENKRLLAKRYGNSINSQELGESENFMY